MKLRNKKTGEIGELMGTERSCPYITIGVDFHDGNPKEYDYTSLAELNEEWEDYRPKEPLIKDKEYRKRIKELAKLLGVEPDDSVWVDTSDSNIKLEFRISFMCTYYLKFCAYTTDLCIKTDYYTLAELCGEEEEPEDDEDEEDMRAEEY